MMSIATDTLAANERRIKPLACCVVTGGDIACVLLLQASMARPPSVVWLCCALASGFLCFQNTYGLIGPGAGIGHIPVSIFALAPAAMSGVLHLAIGQPVWWLSIVALVASSLCIGFFATQFVRIQDTYTHAAPLAPDCALVVLGGYIKDGVPVRTVRRRLEVAARLWREEPQRVIVLTGGPTTDETAEADAMAAWIEHTFEVPRSALLIEREALNTEQNLSYSQDLLCEHGLADRQLCIVSSEYHLYRAMRVARALGIEATCAPAPTPLTSRLQQWSREVLVICAKGFTDAGLARP